MKFNEIQELIKLINKTNISELKINEKEFSITLRTNEFTPHGKKQEPVQQIHVSAPPAVQSVPAATPAGAPVEQGARSQNAISVPTDSKESDAKASENELDDENYIVFRSPMIGTFYRRPSPDKEVFVNVNDQVKSGDVLCVIEAMKLFNEIEYEGEGKIAKVLVEDATPVEYDQPLFLIEPSN